MRWRIESELLAGKGQLICASVTCDRRDNLHSYEVPFKYVEQSVHKMELVKVRTCPECSTMLFYKKLTLETEKQQQETRMTSSISSKKRKSGANTAAAVVDSHDEAVEEDVIEVRKPKVKQKVIDLSTLEETTHNDS